MADFTPTPAQAAAIGHRGSSLLVSAAAGSGKTRVLTERLMAYVTDPRHPVDIDRFLIITYTRAAAGELRSRILDSLARLGAENPGQKGLRRQSALCYRAQIGTIHSFCAAFLRENCHRLGLRPDFRVIEEDRATALQNKILDRLLEERYACIDTDRGFQLLVDTVGAGRNDARLADLVLDLHQKLMSHPWPDRWAEAQAQAFHCPDITDLSETLWGRYLMDRARETVAYWQRELSDLLAETSAEGESAAIAKAYGPSLGETLSALKALDAALTEGWDQAAETLPVPFPRLGALRNSPDPVLSERIKLRRTACKKDMDALAAQFNRPSQPLLAELQAMAPAMEALLQLTLDFDRGYETEKLRLGFLDFSDLEHKALQLLCDPESSQPTELARELSLRYEEVMIDEYQDVNQIQDLIFSSISRERKNLFMVGDVKQSIYRFRLADPGIFIEKYHLYAPEATEADAGRRILLQENFRSRQGILRAANHVFRNIMSQTLGDMAYDEEAALRFGAAYYPIVEEPPVLLSIIDTGTTEEDSEDLNGGDAQEDPEATVVARQIQTLVKTGTLISDGDTQRPVEYKDIVILLRSPSVRGKAYSQALAALGIPVAQQTGENFFSTLEISVVLSLLAIIDNPHQDIPLISVLRSPCFGFTPDELSAIRTGARDCDFYTALRIRGEKDPRCQKFVEALAGLRAVAPDLPVSMLLWEIYDRLDLLPTFSAMGDGQARREHLISLYEYARIFEEGGYRGLFQFVNWIRRAIERGDEAHVISTQDGNAVRIMSIHKSKGLEFPVVFLADLGRRFNKSDATQAVLIHPDLGLGPKYTDSRRRVEYPTVARRAIAKRVLRDTLSEEMRVLYVAMTRAREQLYLSAAMRNPEKALEHYRAALSQPLAPTVLESVSSMGAWLTMTALLPNDAIELQILTPESAAFGRHTPEPQEISEEDVQQFQAELHRRLDFVYPTGVDIPSKVTATELKSRLDAEHRDPEAAALLPNQNRTFRRPNLSASGTPAALNAAERGTATHAALQYLDFSRTGSLLEIREALDELAVKGLLTPVQVQAVDPETLLAFFSSSLGKRIRQSSQVAREFRFSLLRPANTLLETTSTDEVLLQGMVDLYFREGDALVIVDYKTDRVEGQALQDRALSYRPQLRVYAMALARITGLPVKEALLYFLHTGTIVSVPLEEESATSAPEDPVDKNGQFS
jgi:ATP-dependent helicase/nuclease subunit A